MGTKEKLIEAELDLIEATGKQRRERLLEHCSHDTIYDLSYIMKALRERKIDNDDKACAIIELAIDFIMYNRPLTWSYCSTESDTLQER